MDKRPETHETTTAFRLPPRDEDVSRPLLDPQDLEEQPSLSFTFSAVSLLRLPVIPLAVADMIIMGHFRHNVAAGLFYELFPITLCAWTFVSLVNSLGSRRDNFELKFGDYVFFCGKRAKGDSRSVPVKLSRPYIAIAIDLLYCILFIIPSVLSKKEKVWAWWWDKDIFGLSLTLCLLQGIIAALSFFSHFRRAKVVIYAAEYDEKVNYAIPDRQIYLDDGSEPRRSVSSLV